MISEAPAFELSHSDSINIQKIFNPTLDIHLMRIKNTAYLYMHICYFMNITELFKVLSNPVRLRALVLMHKRHPDSLCVCDFMEILDCSQSMISRHFKQLRDLKLVIAEQREQWVHYRLNEDMPKKRWTLLCICLKDAGKEPPFKDDIKRLQKLIRNCS